MTDCDLRLGDCLDVMAGIPDGSVDAVVTDPPAGIGFMGKEWDHNKGGRAAWIGWMAQVAAECLRVIKPGGHALVWAIPRTSHWTATAWEDAGWEVRDRIAHVFGSGFPKSHNLTGEWDGWGTALKPAMEDWWLVRKPLIGTVAENVMRHGTGALNIDGCRVGTDDGNNRSRPPRTPNAILGGGKGTNLTASEHDPLGRWPANLIHDGSDEVMGAFPSSISRQSEGVSRSNGVLKHGGENGRPSHGTFARKSGVEGYADTGSAARFFYAAKTSKSERGEGNTHPTVKPIALMRYLIRLVTPPGGTVLDPFAGSGSTLIAAVAEGFNAIGIERDPGYHAIAQRRIAEARAAAPLFADVRPEPVKDSA